MTSKEFNTLACFSFLIGGTFMLLTKENEVKECVQSTLAYARDHGTLMTGVQLKTLLDIQNVEITKDRASTLL